MASNLGPFTPTLRLTKAGEMIIRSSQEAEAVKQTHKDELKKGDKVRSLVPPMSRVLRRAKESVVAEVPLYATNRIAILGECILPRTQYRGKSFKWVLENDAAYVSYLIRGAPNASSIEGEAVNWAMVLNHLQTYAMHFPQFTKMHTTLVQQRESEVKALASGNPGAVKVGFGKFKDMTLHEFASSNEPKLMRYTEEFLLPKKDIQPGSAMDRLRKFVQDFRSKKSSSAFTTSSAKPVTDPVPASIITPEDAPVAQQQVPNNTQVEIERRRKWNCSSAQASWMELELKQMGLYPGHALYNESHLWEGKPLMRYPPAPELQRRRASALPLPDPFYLHPMFVWAPESVCKSLCPALPCINSPDCHGNAKRKSLGRPRVVVSESGQYYVFATELVCDRCDRRPWTADSPKYLEMLPDVLRNIFPALMTYRKAVDVGLVDRIRRSGRSPADVANEVNELSIQRFERKHLQYLLLLQSVREQARHGSIDTFLGFDVDAPSIDFGEFSDANGYCGVTVSSEFVANCLVGDFEKQKSTLYSLLQGTFGKFLRSDHTRSLAKKVESHSGAMWSYTIMNEFWEVVSWVMVDSESEECLQPCYAGLAQRYSCGNVDRPIFRWVDKWCCVSPPTSTPRNETGTLRWDDLASASANAAPIRSQFARRSACREHLSGDITELLDAFHCIRRFGRCCTTEAHSAYARFMAMLSNAFFLVDQSDLRALISARLSLGRDPDPSKEEIRRHCRMQIPPPYILEERVTAVMLAFCDVKDNRDLPLFTSQMLHEWSLQRTHIRRGCLSDPLENDGVLYRCTGDVHLGGIKSDATRLKTWQGVRGSSQLEGLHPHQTGWVTGSRVSARLFQAQSMFGISKWNLRRAAEHRKLKLPSVFNPQLTAQLNAVSMLEYGSPKYPDFVLNAAETGERFGIDNLLSIAEEDILLEVKLDSAASSESASSVSVHGEVESRIQEEIVRLIKHSEPHVDAIQPELAIEGESALEVEVADTRSPVSVCEASSGATLVSDRKRRRDTDTDEIIRSKQKPSVTRRMTFGGVVTPWPASRWTRDMKNEIHKLLVTVKAPNKYQKIAETYNKLVYDRADDPTSTLKITSPHFVQMYDREVCRKLEGLAVTSSTDEQAKQMKELERNLSQPVTVKAHEVSHAPSRPPIIAAPLVPIRPLGDLAKPRQPDSSSTTTSAAQSDVPPAPTGRQQHRLCSYCKKPKSKMAGQQNLHNTYIRRGQPCFFYCPSMMADKYGTPRTMSFEEFKNTSHFEIAYAALVTKAQQAREKRVAAEAMRLQKGWKKPGGPGGKKN